MSFYWFFHPNFFVCLPNMINITSKIYSQVGYIPLTCLALFSHLKDRKKKWNKVRLIGKIQAMAFMRRGRDYHQIIFLK